MPRNQKRASLRTRQGKPAAVEDQDSVDESPTVGRNKRSTRNLSVSYSDSSRRVSGATPERVTRSRTRASRNEPDDRKATIDSEDDDESFSDSDVSPRKRVRTSRRRSSPKKKGRSAVRGSKAGRGKRKTGRRSRKQDTEDEESEESLDLGDSEEEQEEQENEEEDDESERVKPASATPRRGNRGGTRSSSATTSSTPNVGNKSSPSVVLQRMDNAPASAGRQTRGRGVGRPRKQPQGEDEEGEEVDEEEDAEEERARVSARGGGSRRSARQSQQQQKKKSSISSNKRGKMVPSEENAALTTEAGNNKEEKAADSKEKCEDEEQKPEKDEDIPGDKESTSADAKNAKDESEQTPVVVEKMDVDEPPRPAEDDQEKKETKTEASEVGEITGKHKLEDDEKEADAEAVAKKLKVEEKAEADVEAVEVKKAPVEENEPVSSDDNAEVPMKVEDKLVEATASGDNAVNGEETAKKQGPAPTIEPKVNGSATDEGEAVNEVSSDADNSNGCNTDSSSVIFASLGVKVPRRCVSNPDLCDNAAKDLFSVVSFNLAEEDWTAKHQNLVNEVLQLSPSILCLQEIDELYFKSSLDSALKSHGYMGLYKAGKAPAKGLATFYLLSTFEVLHHREVDVHDLLDNVIQKTNLLDEEKEALKSFLNSPAPVLITKLKSISDGKTVTVGTVSLPSEDESILAIQVAAVVREILDISEGPNNPHVLCGSFSLREDSVVNHLLKDGELKNEILDDLKKKANVPVPDKENAALASLLETSFQHPSASLKSSYESVLGHELKFPDKTQKLSRDSVWFSSNSLLTKSILDMGVISEETPASVHVSLKVELGFVN